MIEVTVSYSRKELLDKGYLPYGTNLLWKYTPKGQLFMFFKNTEGDFEQIDNPHCRYIVIDDVIRGIA